MGKKSYLFRSKSTEDAEVEIISQPNSQAYVWKRKVSLLHESMIDISKLMLHAGGRNFYREGEGHETWRCFNPVVSYCCDVLGRRDM